MRLPSEQELDEHMRAEHLDAKFHELRRCFAAQDMRVAQMIGFHDGLHYEIARDEEEHGGMERNDHHEHHAWEEAMNAEVRP